MRGEWESYEDELLKKALDQYGEGKWKRLPDSPPSPPFSLQCSNRWHNHLVFLNVSCGEWSAEEEAHLRTAVEQQENKAKKSWKIVAAFPGVKSLLGTVQCLLA